MKASEVIAALRKLVEQHGDLEVRVFGCDDDACQMEVVSLVEVQDEIANAKTMARQKYICIE